MARYADISNYSQEEIDLWEKLMRLQYEKELRREKFKTARGLEFTYHIAGNELFIDRKKKSITRSTVNMAYRNAKELKAVNGPKQLKVFGASYLYPLFLELGVCFKE